MISEISCLSCNALQGLRMPTVLCYVRCLTFVSGFDSFRAHHLFKNLAKSEISRKSVQALGIANLATFSCADRISSVAASP
jgi:hypothetical protein